MEYKITMSLLKKIGIGSLCIFAITTHAQQPTEQQVTKLIQVMNVEQLLQETVQQLKPQFDQQANSVVKSIVKKEQLSPEQQKIADEFAEHLFQYTLNAIAWDKMKPIYEKIYKDIYNEKEVQAQIDFYSSAIGQAILKKTPLVAEESMKLVNQQLMSTLQNSEKEFMEINKKLSTLK